MFIESGSPRALCVLCRARVADTVIYCRTCAGDSRPTVFTAPACRECTRLRLPWRHDFTVTHEGAPVADGCFTLTTTLTDL